MPPQQPNSQPVLPPESIFAQIRYETDQFLYNFISPVPGYAFNQYQTLKRIFLYLSNKYENGSFYLGREKLFFNVVNPAVEVATKMLNIDTKDIRLVPTNPKSQFSTYLLEKELQLWLKTSEMGRILNTIAEEAPRYGSVLLEKTKKGARVCDLRRTMLDPSVDNAKDSRFITTIHYMSDEELRKTGWDNVELAIQRFGNTQAAQPFEDNMGNMNVMRSSPQVKVYKRYGEVPEKWLKKGSTSNKMVRSLFIVVGPDMLQRNSSGQMTQELGVILFKSEWKGDYPFMDFHYTKIKGRWLGMGVVETLFDYQTRMNELKNQKRLSMELSTLHLFQTKDKQLVRNVLTDLENGDIMYSPAGIEPIVNEERNLPAFDGEEASYLAEIDRVSFAYEANRGEVASDTTLGQTEIAVAQSTSVFAFKKQNLALMLRPFFNELVMPQLLRDLTPEHIMRFTGSTQELNKLDEAAAEIHVNDEIKKKVLAGIRVNLEFQELVRQDAIKTYRKLGSNRYLKIKENFYGDAEYEFDFKIDNEAMDPNKILQGVQYLMANFMSNPVALQDPRVKLMYDKAAQQFGISTAEIELAHNIATEMLNAGQLPTLAQEEGQEPIEEELVTK